MEEYTIGKRIATLRKNAGMSEKELAEKLLVKESKIKEWEKDSSSPDLYFIPVLADIFNVSCDELLRFKRDHAPAVPYFNADTGASLEKKGDKKKIRKKVLLVFGIPCLCVFLFLTVSLILFSSVVTKYDLAKTKSFETYASFQTYMETEAYGDDFDIDEPPVADEKLYYILDENGNEQCEFYWRNQTVKQYVVSENNDGLPIRVYTERALKKAEREKGAWLGCMITATAIDCAVFVFVYCIKMKAAGAR